MRMNQEEEVYNRLAARYNEHAIGAPLTKEFINILKLLFDPAEAGSKDINLARP